MDVDGKVVVVAGGASGLGRAVCEDLARHGAKVGVLDRNGEAASELAAELGEALAVETDVTSGESVTAAVGRVVSELGTVHVNVNTAGIPDANKIVNGDGPAPLDWFERVLAVNLTGTFNVMRICAAAMLDNEPDESGERGVIVNTSSGAAFDGQVGQAAYSASKAGVVGMTLPVARDLAGKGIRVNAIAPGLFDTPMIQGVPAKVAEGMVRMMLEPPRMGDPAEFASLVHHLIENRYMNAECVRIDAGTRLNAR